MACRLPIDQIPEHSNFIVLAQGYRPKTNHGLRRNVNWANMPEELLPVHG